MELSINRSLAKERKKEINTRIEQRIKALEEDLSKEKNNPSRKRLNEIIKEALKGLKETRILYKSCLENVRNWIKRREEKVIKLVEEFENKHGKLR